MGSRRSRGWFAEVVMKLSMRSRLSVIRRKKRYVSER